MIPFLVSEFGKLAISNLIKEAFPAYFPDIYNKKQVDYIFRYLKDLGAKTVVLETNYVDKDFIEDYSKFYVKRFNSKDYKCSRLHFFKASFTHKAIDRWLSDGIFESETSQLQDSYLGFSVIKPLPRTFIGKTCLINYPCFDEESRVYLSREYAVNLFGIKLKVNSIAFQEQDKVVSACATTAIWSAMHAVDYFPIRAIPSSSEITTVAINYVQGSNNQFPTYELSGKQILRALDTFGFKYHTQSMSNAKIPEFIALVECYLRSGIPIILGSDVMQKTSQGYEKIGAHASTIVGCDLSEGKKALYVHDDRLGPFARAEVNFREYKGSQRIALYFKDRVVEDVENLAEEGPEEFLLIDSTYAISDKKVRLPRIIAERTCDFLVKTYVKTMNVFSMPKSASGVGSGETEKLTYKIELVETSKLKADIVSKVIKEELIETDIRFKGWSDSPSERRKFFLSQPLARFQWVARFYLNGKESFLVLMDSTDIPQGDAVSYVYAQDTESAAAIITLLNKFKPTEQALAEEENVNLYSSFLRRISPSVEGVSDYLDRQFGAPRAPLKLKANESTNGDIVSNPNLEKFFDSEHEALSLDKKFNRFLNGGVTDDENPLIWVIDHEGALLIGKEDEKLGHPTLTGFKPARIGGELKRVDDGWVINSKSGRYSSNYKNPEIFLNNALLKFKNIFRSSADNISVEGFLSNEKNDGVHADVIWH